MKNYLATIIKDYDLLHIHGSEHQYEVMALPFDIPKVISIQGILTKYIKVLPKLENYKRFIEWKLAALYEKSYLPYYENFSCRTHWDEGFIKEINPNANVYTIWEIIRPPFFENHFSSNSNKILFMGGKNPLKGLKELLGAFSNTLQSKGLELIILGNCQTTDIEKIVLKYGYTNINMSNIHCRGIQGAEGVLKAYDESFCLVHPTYIDNSPNSVCEAQLAGLPVIASNVGGVSSLINNRETGILISLDIVEIGNSVMELYYNHQLREHISTMSRRTARERHNPDKILNDTLEMYADIIKTIT